jgi:hypothetical protein
MDNILEAEANKPKNCCGPRIRLARRRTSPQVSQQDLVARLETYGININQGMLSKIENQARPVTDIELKAIGEALAISVAWLIREREM